MRHMRTEMRGNRCGLSEGEGMQDMTLVRDAAFCFLNLCREDVQVCPGHT